MKLIIEFLFKLLSLLLSLLDLKEQLVGLPIFLLFLFLSINAIFVELLHHILEVREVTVLVHIENLVKVIDQFVIKFILPCLLLGLDVLEHLVEIPLFDLLGGLVNNFLLSGDLLIKLLDVILILLILFIEELIKAIHKVRFKFWSQFIVQSDLFEHCVEIPAFNLFRNSFFERGTVLHVAIVLRKVVVNLCQLVSILRVWALAPFEEVLSFIKDIGQGLNLILAHFLVARLTVMLSQLIKEVTHLNSAHRCGLITSVSPAVTLPVIQLD